MNPHQKKLIKTILIACIVLLFFSWMIKHFKQKPPESTLPPVVIQKPKSTQITEYVTQTGTLVAFNSVNLVARIEGYLTAIEFIDGTMVKKDSPLFVVEPAPYLEQLKAAEAAVAIQKASYAYAEAEYHRQKKMYTQQATSLNNVEKWLAKTLEYKAEIEKAVANAENAKITYSYTHVQAPFDGRIGRHLVDAGNLVGNGKATNLATIEQIDPIYVYFNLNELDLIKIRTAARAVGFKPADLNQVPVYVGMQNETGFPHEGKLNFVNTGLNASTGTIEFRALLPNKDYTLLPGSFVQVRIPIGKPKSQLTVPDLAIQYDQIGAYLLITDKQNRVVEKHVELGTLEQGMRVITKGIDAQDNVIVSGVQNAIPGMQVAPVQGGKSS